jgi:outer membrane protein TolC
MTIKTLSYIHSLLIKEEASTQKKVEWLREIYYAAETALENGDGSKADMESKKQQYEQARDDNMTAYHALRDFESQEW